MILVSLLAAPTPMEKEHFAHQPHSPPPSGREHLPGQGSSRVPRTEFSNISYYNCFPNCVTQYWVTSWIGSVIRLNLVSGFQGPKEVAGTREVCSQRMSKMADPELPPLRSTPKSQLPAGLLTNKVRTCQERLSITKHKRGTTRSQVGGADLGCDQVPHPPRWETNKLENDHHAEVLLSYIGEELATHSSVLSWRIPGMGEPGELPSMGSHRVRHNWSDLAAAAAEILQQELVLSCMSGSPALESCPSKMSPQSIWLWRPAGLKFGSPMGPEWGKGCEQRLHS